MNFKSGYAGERQAGGRSGRTRRRRNSMRIGVLSDTHGLVRPEALTALEGVELIVHAGDIGKLSVIESLEKIAPVKAVRGNVDTGAWADRFPLTEVVECGVRQLYVLHKPAELDLDPVAAGVSAVITGHTHRPLVERRDGVLHLNPGSAGPRRFHLPICLALLHVEEPGRRDALEAELVELVLP